MKLLRITTGLIVVLSLVACGVTRQARDVKQSGFLGDYSILKPGPDGGARLVYLNPSANIKSYDKILLEPVTIWTAEGSQMNDLSKEDRVMVANRLYALLQARLAKDYKLVAAPEPGTMVIAAALTSAESSYPVLDTISTIVPVGLAVSTLKAAATGRPAFVGEASAEMKITDASTGTILFEGADSRVGTKNPSGVWNEWEDVDSALAYWTDRLGYRLCVERGGTGCVAP
jgi:hypothetical protein